MELIPNIDSGECVFSGLPTHYKYQGNWVSEHFLIGANKLLQEFGASDPSLTFDKAMEILMGAQIYRNHFGEEKMEVETLKEQRSWKSKLKMMLGR